MNRTFRSARQLAASPLAFGAVLLAYGNGSAWLFARRSGETPVRFNWAHMAMLGLTLAWSAAERTSAHELGLERGRATKSLAYGMGAGALGSLGVGVVTSVPVISRSLAVPEIAALPRSGVARLLLGQFLLGSALFEEMAFRGLLQAKLARTLGPIRALIVTSGAFALWHGLIVWHNCCRLGVPRNWLPMVHGSVLGTLFVSGVGLGLLRHWTGHLAAPIAAHWIVLVAIVARLRVPQKKTNAPR